MKIPKKWIKSKCASCRYFWAYPISNGDYEDWTWECESLDVEADDLVQTDEDCEGFEPKPRSGGSDE